MARLRSPDGCFQLVIAVICVIQSVLSSALACPVECSCFPATNTVICSNPALSGFPAGVPIDTKNLLIRGTAAHRLVLQEIRRDDLKSLKNMHSLVITNTLLSSVGNDAFVDLKDLNNLDLSFNQIDKMEPGLFGALSALKSLQLTGNQHRYLTPGLFTGLTSLRELYLGSMRLAAITPDIFTGLDSLVALDLSNNDLDDLPVAFASGTVLSQLQMLDLTFNSLTELSGALEPLLQSVRNIKLADNPWHCSCGQIWLKSYPQHIYADYGTKTITCATPADLLYESLATVSDDRLSCIAPTVTCQHPPPVEDGQTLNVSCQVTGDPFPNVTWSVADGSVVKGSGDFGRGVIVNRSGDLVELVVRASLAWNGTLRVMCRNQKGANHSDVNVVVYPITTTTTTTTTAVPTTSATTTASPATTQSVTVSQSPPAITTIITTSAATSKTTATTGPVPPSSTPSPSTRATAASLTSTPSPNGPATTKVMPSQTQTSANPVGQPEKERPTAVDTSLEKITMLVALGIAVLALLTAGLVGALVCKTLRIYSYRVNPETYGNFSRTSSSATPTTCNPRVMAPISTTLSGEMP